MLVQGVQQYKNFEIIILNYVRMMTFKMIYFFIFFLQYNAIDTNPLSIYVMHPFWNKLVEVRDRFMNTIINIIGTLSNQFFFFYFKAVSNVGGSEPLDFRRIPLHLFYFPYF